MSDLARLANFCRENDLPWNDRVDQRFASYLHLVVHFNEAMNLIGPLSGADIVDELLIDSVAPAAVYGPQGTIHDVGAGAGLPGIPLHILYPDLPLTLVEPRRKRATFLKIVINRLDLEAATVVDERIEDLAPKAVEYVISKAFQPPAVWLQTAHRWVSDNGVVVCLTRPAERERLERRGDELGLERLASCDDTATLGAPAVGEPRAVYVFGR